MALPVLPGINHAYIDWRIDNAQALELPFYFGAKSCNVTTANNGHKLTGAGAVRSRYRLLVSDYTRHERS